MPSYDEKEKEVLELEVRRKIFNVVRNFAGCHLREIQRTAKMSFGGVSYHLAYLERHQLIKTEKDGRNIRYFPMNLSFEDERLLSLLRQKSVRTMLLFIFSNEGCTHIQIVSSLKLSASTITWHLKKLLLSGIISENKMGKFKTYILNIPKARIMNLLIFYRESFLDKLVDGLIDLWEY